ncbi:hypothetical protein FJT64_003299 [Amphibalanus amphitrite]|uniref:Transmembrane protein n=1 Tax=Amphibalanus amphitrite TaxID=1232801 RepID=A0A6A4VWM5_AMPAM|nr:hypothetical protein FJT64_003299 [Amphibalanus amphitrite]
MAMAAVSAAGAETAPESAANFLRRYRALFPAPAAAVANPGAGAEAARMRREFAWQPLRVNQRAAALTRQDRRMSNLGAEPDSVNPPPPSDAIYPDPDTYSDTDDDDDDTVRSADDGPSHNVRDDGDDDLAAAGTESDDDSETDLEEEVLRAPAVPPARKKALTLQRVDEAWVKAGLLELIGKGKLRTQLRHDVRDKVTKEEITGALRPVFATNFTARFTADTCDTLHAFREGVQKRTDDACWYCQERNGGPPAGRHGKCMQICQVTRLDVACKRRSDERFMRVLGLAEPVEGRRFRRACNDTCMEEWELLLQYGAAARLRAELAAATPVHGRSRAIVDSVSARQQILCPDKFQLRYRLCYPVGSWAQRTIIDLEHTAWVWIVLGILGALSLLCCLAACCYYKVLQVPRIAAKVNGWLRRRRMKWRVAGGVERTESGHYRRPSMVATGAHGKTSRNQIKQTVERWRRQRAAEGRRDGAPRSIFSAVQMIHPPRDAAAAQGGDDTSVFSEQIDADNSG